MSETKATGRTTPKKTKAKKQEEKAQEAAEERIHGLRFAFSDGLTFHAADFDAWDQIQVQKASEGRLATALDLVNGLQTFNLEAIGCMYWVADAKVHGSYDEERLSYQQAMQRTSLGEIEDIGDLHEGSDDPT